MLSKIVNRQLGLDSNYKTWHINGENMLIYIHSGDGSIVCRDKIYSIKKGVLCFIGAKVWHYTMPMDASAYERSKIFADQDEFNKILSLISKDEDFSRYFHEESFVYAEIPEKDCTKIEELIGEITNYEGNKKYENLVFLSCFIRLLVFINNNIVDIVSSPEGDMNKAVEYINHHICSKIGIEDICRHIHMSKYHFCRKFKENTELTVMEYVLKTRIVFAKNMLAKENLSISEISEHCGFSSISYFCRVFKESTGQTPLQFRKSQRGI